LTGFRRRSIRKTKWACDALHIRWESLPLDGRFSSLPAHSSASRTCPPRRLLIHSGCPYVTQANIAITEAGRVRGKLRKPLRCRTRTLTNFRASGCDWRWGRAGASERTLTRTTAPRSTEGFGARGFAIRSLQPSASWTSCRCRGCRLGQSGSSRTRDRRSNSRPPRASYARHIHLRIRRSSRAGPPTPYPSPGSPSPEVAWQSSLPHLVRAIRGLSSTVYGPLRALCSIGSHRFLGPR
jgi:hypothetical protein